MKVPCLKSSVAVLVVALSGCTSGPATQQSGAAVVAPAVTWDGTYRGSVQITGLGSGVQRRWCETDPQMVVQVAGNSFTYAMPHPNAPGNPTPVYQAAIASDGTFSGRISSGLLEGRVEGHRMAGVISGSVCTYSFSLDRL